jgi:hypothetical protein
MSLAMRLLGLNLEEPTAADDGKVPSSGRVTDSDQGHGQSNLNH